MSERQYAALTLDFNRQIVDLLDALSALAELAQLSIHAMDEGTLLRKALAALMANQDMERCSIFLIDPAAGELYNAAGMDWEDMLRGVVGMPDLAEARPIPTRYPASEGIMGQVATSGIQLHCHDCKSDPRFSPHGRIVSGALLSTPITCEGSVLGVLNVFHPTTAFFDQWHERLVLLFCQSLGRLLTNHRLTHHLNQLVEAKTVEIAQQHGFLQSILDSVPEPIMVIGRDYRILMANRAARPSDAPLDKELRCHRHTHHRDTPCDGADHACPLQRVLSGEGVTTVVHEHFDTAGNPRLVELKASPLLGADGSIIGIVESAHDITEREQAAQALKEARDYAESLLHTANAMIMELDAEGKLQVCNPAAESITGYTLAELQGRDWFEVLAPQDRYPQVRKEFERLLTGGLPRNFETPILTKNGEERFIVWQNSVLHKDGQTDRVIACGIDISARKEMEEALAKTSLRLLEAQRIAHIGSWERDCVTDRMACSAEMQSIIGNLHCTGCADCRFGRLYDAIHPADRARFIQDYETSLVMKQPFEFTHRVVREDGTVTYVHTHCETLYDASGKPLRSLGTMQDVTATVLTEISLRESEERFRTIADYTYDWEYWEGPKGEILYTSQSCLDVTGYTVTDFIVQPELIYLIIHPEDRPLMETHRTDILHEDACTLNFRIVRRDGAIRWIAHGCRRVFGRNGRFMGRRASNRDITELKEAEERIRQLAYYDTLTQLPNRRLLIDRLDHALAQARRFSRSLAVMFLDLDRFKQINDTLGHSSGDDLLQQVARRLVDCVREGDTVARPGGDEFVIVLTEISQPEDAALVAEKIIAAFDAPFPLGAHAFQVTTSIGIAVYPVNGTDDVDELMKKADLAMYRAKEGGRNGYRFFAGETGNATPVEPVV
jgi:diguanylate cyclase (GGDEF)-like protein/PAS domain S-box-containing protein